MWLQQHTGVGRKRFAARFEVKPALRTEDWARVYGWPRQQLSNCRAMCLIAIPSTFMNSSCAAVDRAIVHATCWWRGM